MSGYGYVMLEVLVICYVLPRYVVICHARPLRADKFCGMPCHSWLHYMVRRDTVCYVLLRCARLGNALGRFGAVGMLLVLLLSMLFCLS